MNRFISKSEIEEFEKIFRINLINSITGIKPANLIGTRSTQGSNLAIFSSVVHMGSNPPLIGMISRPSGEVERHTFTNIEKTGYYTINHLKVDDHRSGHYTSAKFSNQISEFDACGFTEYYSASFFAPYVAESSLSIGMRYLEAIPIKQNGTLLILGEVEEIRLNGAELEPDGSLNLESITSTGISGLDTYYRLQKVAKHPFARVKDM
ncbi:MAG: flavin reductase [Saprospiraceae bacterium]|nr:flavin reductase [Saprospiraceae bacterium]